MIDSNDPAAHIGGVLLGDVVLTQVLRFEPEEQR
jgi:hypothetical protein